MGNSRRCTTASINASEPRVNIQYGHVHYSSSGNRACCISVRDTAILGSTLYLPFIHCPALTVPRHLSCLSEERSEEHTSELQSLMRISYAVFCLKKKNKTKIKRK